jgi:hypothetical protein
MTERGDPRGRQCDHVESPTENQSGAEAEENEVVSFAHFHSFGFEVLAHPLLWWLMYYYGLASMT